MKVHVVGTGLIGTSVGLALAGQADVVLSDASGTHLARAVERGAGRRWDGVEQVDLVLVCTPPSRTAAVISDALVQHLGSTVSHVAGEQSRVQHEVEAATPLVSALCGGHPLAGRERSGPDAATARLFLDRSWVVCPSRSSSAASVQAVTELALACGAVPVRASAREHDEAVALVSHLPQIAASAVAARLVSSTRPALDPARLAGPGIQDTTRIAASDPDLWVEILSRNAGHVAPLVRALSADLADVARALDQLADGQATEPAAQAVLRSLLDRGRAGRERLPVKHGLRGALTSVVVSVADTPGQLAAVLVAAADAELNVEDVRVEHLPGRARGQVELLVPLPDAGRARAALSAAGWTVVDAG